MTYYMPPKITALSGVLAAIMTLVVIVLGGYYQPNYSHAQNFVSELNDAGSLYPSLIAYLGFIPVGIVTLFFIGRLKQELEWTKRVAFGLSFLCFSGVDWFVTAVFPCDAGCPATGDISVFQTIHNLSGLFSTILVPVGIYLLIRPLNEMKFHPIVTVFSTASIVAYATSFILIVVHVFDESQGGIQRISIFTFYAYLSVLSLVIYKKEKQSGG